MLFDVLLIVLLLVVLGGFGYSTGWHRRWRSGPPGSGYIPPGTVEAGTEGPGYTGPTWGPIQILLLVLLVLLILALLLPWPIPHAYYRW